MGTNTGIGIGIGIPFRNNALGGDNIYFPPELKARMIGVWDNYGKKNTDADRNIIKNKIPNAGGDLEILNAAYKLNSGFGEYKFDFERWALTKPSTTCKKYNDSFNITYVGRPVSEGECIVETGNNSDSDIQVYFKVEISGIEDDMEGWFNTANFRNRQQLYNGINIINVTVNSKHWYGFDFIRTDGTALGKCNIVVKQIPEFEGALVTDGINDIIASIKTLEDWNVGNKGITIISMIHQITTNKNFTTTNNLRNEGRVVGRNVVSNTGKTGIYGWYKEDLQGKTATLISNILGDKNDYTGHYTESTNPITNSKFYVQGYAIENGFTELSSVAHYWTFAVLGKATEDEINLIIAKYNLDRTLRPDILCNITKQGITNDNHADFNDKLVDYSGNGRDIQMYNLAWKGSSGVATKKFETIKDYLIVPDEGLQELTIFNEFSYKVKSIKYADRYWTIQTLNKTDVSYPITIVSDKDIIWRNTINYTDENGVKRSIRKETNVPANTPTQVFVLGFNDFDVPDNYTKVNCVAYATRTDITEFTITFIPSCKGGILLDGIEDFGKVTGMPIYKDYTFIIDRKFLNETFANQVCLASKSKVAVEGENGGAFIIDNISINAIINPYSFYKTTSLPNLNTFDKQIVFQTKYRYLDKDIAAGTATDSDTLWLGTFRDNDSRFANVAIYSLMSFPYSMSEFLIERQLKKHKLGTLYPDMVEFRPVINSNVLLDSKPTFVIRGTSTHLNAGDYVPENSQIWVSIKMNNIADRITKFTVNGKTIDISENAYSEVTLQYGFPFVIDKSPQKIGITIEQDENYVLFNPVITSNVEYHRLDFYLNNYQKIINIGDYIPKDAYLRANIYLNNNVDELTAFIFNGVNIGYRRSSVDDTAFNISHIYNYDSPQEVNITIDEYIRYEDIVQPYPVLLRFNDENGNEVSWGGKFRVGSTITRIVSAADSNLLPNIYNIFGLLLNDNQVTSSKVIVEKTMVFKAKSAYIFDNNEPNCILSPRLLRIPNSSYKILGYIPDISGHGNHGVIHNSAYAEGSGVNEDGSYQFDGVDDFVTIPTVTGGGKQVLMKVNNNTINSMLYDQRSSYASPNSLYNDFAIYCTNSADNNQIAYQSRLVGNTYIDGILNTNITCEDLLGVLHNITITCDIVAPNNGVVPNIGRGGVLKDLYSKVALYDFMLFDNISTDDKIKELNEYVGIEAKVELPPYYWDAYGKTNLDADKATIQQRGVAEGDYDITNYNHAYDKMSGYGGYNLGRFDKSWASSSSSNTSIKVVQRNPYDITLKKLGGNSDWEFNNTELKVISNPVSVKFKSNKNIRVTCDYHYHPVGGNSEGTPLRITSKDLIANKDAIITISPISQENIDKYNIDVNRGYYLIYFQLSSTLAVNEEVTIEMLPLYPNGLVCDGVTDYSENANIPALTDFTYVFKRKLLDNVAGCASMTKGLTDQQRAVVIDYINTTGGINGTSFGNMAFVPSLRDSDIIYSTTTNINGTTITKGNNPDSNGIDIGKFATYYKKMVFYKLILYPKTIPLLQINFLKNLMERDEIIDLDNPIFKK
jgi:hypothetical protein